MHDFDQSYREWIQSHVVRRSGERRRRLQDGNLFAEKEALRTIWWPAFGHFEHLHPEYEVTDFQGGPRFLDFAYLRASIRIAIEIDGFGPHCRDISRRQFCDQWVRQMHLVNDNWIIVRIGYDDVKARPRLWQQLLQQMMGRLFGDPAKQLQKINHMEREIIRLAMHLGRAVKLSDVQNHLNCGYRTARSLLESLADKKWLFRDGGGSQRIHSWKLDTSNKRFLP